MKRKLIIVPLIIALLVTCMLQVFAADNDSSNGVAVTNGVGAPGKQVSLQVSMPSRMTDSVGLIITYDKEILTLSEESKWLLNEDSGLADVKVEEGIAAWAGNAIDIKGDIFELVFMINENAEVGTVTDISCQLRANLGTSVELTGLATATVTVQNLAKITGTVTSYGDTTNAITVELLDSTSQIVQTKVLENGENTYEFDVEQDVYTIRISKSKHCPREYEIAMENLEDKVQDVEICLYGDVMKDGVINSRDALEILKKVANKSNMVTEWTEYTQVVGDVTGDGLITARDANEVLKKSTGKPSMFEQLP